MERLVKIDPFFDKQPPLSFVEDLKKPLHVSKPEYYGKREIEAGEIDAHGIYIDTLYPDDPDGLLETVYTDLKLFFDIYGIGGDKYPIKIVKGEVEGFESYTVEVTADGIIVTANDTEGVRRALIFIEDELRRRENAYLEVGVTKRVPHIRSRITRCFFSPINRPPKFGDELSDDIDYYPEEYLNRLMHDGANGVWIYTRFSDIIPSSFIIENGKGFAPRIAKLNRVIEKCRRYGIGVYVFAIEPVALTPEQVQKYPELAGSRFGQNAMFCAGSKEGQAFCYEAGARLMQLCPKLAGYISITQGERNTSCASAYVSGINCPRYKYVEGINCHRCASKKPGEILSQAVDALRSGIRAVNPKCETVSWTYGARIWEFDDIRDYVRSAPSDVMLMQNFEDMGYEEQLGELRQGEDYWLSYVGPSELFKITAEEAKKCGKHMFAKMQVCCSHEIASVPYVPVPGIIFKKYKAAHELGIEGVMQCWYFGNYPSMMSKAAGELAFDDFEDEDRFLTSLASIYWGRTKAPTVVEAWKAFEASYRQYPLNVMFSYYGPMHDGVVWKLALKPKNFSLPRTWQGLDPIDGDRIGEALLNGHTLDEALTLVNGMCDKWDDGIEALAALESESDDEVEQHSVADAIQLLFSSGRNIVEFYQLRDLLGRRIGDASEIFEKLRDIVESEIENSRAMITLCENDNRLGYHSEAEGYKFFPEKLTDRIAQLEELLTTEFVEVEQRIKDGQSPLEYYDGVEDNDKIKRYTMSNSGLRTAPWEFIGDKNNSKFRIAYDAKHIYLELCSERKVTFGLSPEFKLLWPDATMNISDGGKLKLGGNSFMYNSLFGEREQKEYDKYSHMDVCNGLGTHVVFTFDIEKIGLDVVRPFKLKVIAGGASWCNEDKPVHVLGKSDVSPGEYGWILPQPKAQGDTLGKAFSKSFPQTPFKNFC